MMLLHLLWFQMTSPAQQTGAVGEDVLEKAGWTEAHQTSKGLHITSQFNKKNKKQNTYRG